MKKNYSLRNLITAVLFSVSVSGFSQVFDSGIFVLNEGGAGSNNASVSFLEYGAAQPQNNIYASVNQGQGALGDTAQSMSFNDIQAYIVLNVSNTVKIVRRDTFEYVATVSTGLANPRYIAFANGKGYITNWANAGSSTDDYIAILDLQTNTVTGTIPAPEGVERIISLNDKLYVAHQGGYGFGNTISVINPVTNQIESTITVGDVPNRMVEHEGFLYVLCGGIPSWSPDTTSGSLVKIDLATNTVVATTPFTGMNPSNLQIDEQENIYFTSDSEVYKASLSNPADYTELLSIAPQGVYGIYGMDLIDDKLYVADAVNYVSPGTAYVFSKSGVLQNEYTVGVIPNSFYRAEGTLGIPAHDNVKFAVYPNPATDRFFIKADQNAKVGIYDYSGRAIVQADYTESGIDVSSFQAGVYIVKITEGKNTATQKLIVR